MSKFRRLLTRTLEFCTRTGERMIFIKFKSQEDTTIEFIHHIPFDPVYGLDKTEEELNEEGLLVEELPVPESLPGKREVLKYSVERDLYYEYIDNLITPEQEVENMKKQVALMQQALDELLLGVCKMANYLAQRVIDTVYTYDHVISKRPDLRSGIDKYLIDNGREDLITVQI
jgi:hypothetical protein